MTVVAGLGLGLLFAAAGRLAAQEEEAAIFKPTREHALLKSDVGTWDCTTRTWMGPGEPAVSKGKEVNTMLPGGLWLLSEFDGEFGGMPFHGRGQFGYDTNKKKYVGTWVDSFSTSAMLLEGTYDEATHTLTMLCDTLDIQGKPLKTKRVLVLKPDGSRVLTMWVKSDAFGPDYVRMTEIMYTKEK
jgi:hypothetical protein